MRLKGPQFVVSHGLHGRGLRLTSLQSVAPCDTVLLPNRRGYKNTRKETVQRDTGDSCRGKSGKMGTHAASMSCPASATVTGEERCVHIFKRRLPDPQRALEKASWPAPLRATLCLRPPHHDGPAPSLLHALSDSALPTVGSADPLDMVSHSPIGSRNIPEIHANVKTVETSIGITQPSPHKWQLSTVLKKLSLQGLTTDQNPTCQPTHFARPFVHALQQQFTTSIVNIERAPIWVQVHMSYSQHAKRAPV